MLTLSSGLSGTLELAHMARNMAEYDRITIIDTLQVVMSQRMLVEHAVKMRNSGAGLGKIVREIRDLRERSTVVGVIGDALQIKPVITHKGKIETVGKAGGLRAGNAMAWKFRESRGVDADFPLVFGYTSSLELGEAFRREPLSRFAAVESRICQVGGIIGTHLGENPVGVAFVTAR